MPAPTPDIIIAHVRVLRLTDQILGLADELRHALDQVDILLERNEDRPALLGATIEDGEVGTNG